jgi:two-component system sensor histidine kinase KdpD
VRSVNKNEFSEAYTDMLSSLDIRLREKLSVLLPALDLLEKRVAGDADETVLRYLGEARRSALSILRMARNLGDQAKYAADYDMSDPVNTDLSGLFASIAAETRKLAVYKEADISLHCPEVPFYAFIDPGMISRLFYNLLSNAVLHGNGDVSAELTREDGGIILRVRNGSADGEETLARIQRKRSVHESPEGAGSLLGMGLSVASAIVRQCGGVMMLTSDKANEMTVTVSLPDIPGTDEMEFGLPEDACAFPAYLVELSDFPAYNPNYNLQKKSGSKGDSLAPAALDTM